ncbi:MAG: prepilin-type N-terminal cleavage/methylation domain-containing protein [Planctomycetota bacterium]
MRGLTLVELLAVIVIIGLLLGLSVSVFVRLQSGVTATSLQDRLTTTIRATRHHATSGGPGAFVVLFPSDAFSETSTSGSMMPIGGIQSFRFVPAAAWHCDRPSGSARLDGAFEINGSLRGSRFVPGLYGDGIQIDGSDEALFPSPYSDKERLDGKGALDKKTAARKTSCVEIASRSDLDIGLGMHIEIHVRIDRLPMTGTSYLLIRERAYYILVSPDWTVEAGTPNAWVASDIRLPQGQWSKITLRMDRMAYELRIDDMLAGTYVLNKDPAEGYRQELTTSEGPSLTTGPAGDCATGGTLYFGNPKGGGMTGVIDEVSIYRLEADDLLRDPDPTGGFGVDPERLSVIHFLPDGRLDVRRHSGGVALWFTRNKREYPTLISLLGEVISSDPVDEGDTMADMRPFEPEAAP